MNNVEIRKNRQIVNNNIVLNILLDKSLSIENTLKEIKKKGNIQSFIRLKDYISLNDSEIILRSREDVCFAKTIAFSIAKCSSRQGSRDETNNYKTINDIVNIPNKKNRRIR